MKECLITRAEFRISGSNHDGGIMDFFNEKIQGQIPAKNFFHIFRSLHYIFDYRGCDIALCDPILKMQLRFRATF